MQKAVDEGEGTTDLQMNSNPNLCGRIMLLELILKQQASDKDGEENSDSMFETSIGQ